MFDESDVRFELVPGAPVEVIPWGAVWKYDDSNSDPGSSWTKASFSDGAWKEGAAQLGYGDGDEVTTLTDYDPNATSYYFRKSFTLDDDAKSAVLEVIHDDGVAVWINGTEVLSKYMGFGTSHLVYSSAQSSDNEYGSAELGASSPLKAGENVVAAMVKQRSEGSSDVSFDLRLVVVPDAEVEPMDDGGGTDDGTDGTDGTNGTGDGTDGTNGTADGTNGTADGTNGTADGTNGTADGTDGTDGTNGTAGSGIPAVESDPPRSSEDDGCGAGSSGRSGGSTGWFMVLWGLLALLAVRRFPRGTGRVGGARPARSRAGR